jgi:citrate synthase
MSTVGKGLEGVVVSESQLSYVDGESGKLYYRGYDVPELAARTSYEEVLHLLWYGALPSRPQLARLKERLAISRVLPDGAKAILRSIPKESEPIDVLRSMVSVLGLYDPNANDNSPEAVDAKSISLTAKFTTVLAAFNRLRQGLEPIDPDPTLDHAADFLYMFTGKRPDQRTSHALDTYLVLLADHEYNASTFAARQITSTLTDTYSAITGAIAALKGPLHGGAPTGVYNMLMEIGTPDKASDWFEAAMERRERVSGIGHRVYKVMDPRATVLREHARELTLSTGNPIYYTISRQVELLALSHPYFQERRLYTNVDYYTVAVLYSLGIPVEYMTPLFAVSRVGGWTAHIQEQLRNNRLIRPRAQYVGPIDAVWLPIDERAEGQILLPDGNIFEPPNV